MERHFEERTSFARIVVSPRTLMAAFVAIVLFLVLYFADYGNWFIHPHEFEIHLPKLLADGPALRPRSFANIFQQFDPNEYRPRFLAYAIIWANLNLRMWLYDWFVLYPPFSVGWLFELLVAPFLLFRLTRNLTGRSASAWTALIVYVTSTGFLSGVAMPLMPSKPMTNVVFIAVLWLLSEARKVAAPGQLLHELPHGRRTMLALGALLLAGLFLDEVPLFAFLLPLLFFPELFFPGQARLQDLARATRSWLPLALPPLLFLAFVIIVVPRITRKLFGFQFDYLASVLVRDGVQVGKSFFSGAAYGFSLESLGANVLTFFGLPFVPWQAAPLVQHPSGAGVVTGMQPNALLIGVVAIVLLGAFAVGCLSQQRSALLLRRALVASLLFILFMSLLSGRHVPFITGYVYGCAFPVFLALMFGSALDVAQARRAKVAIAVVALFAACIQLVNFHAINQNWIALHNEGWTRKQYEEKLPIASDGRKTTRGELHAIWSAWRAGHLDTYVSAHSISSGAVFLIFELRHLEKWRPPPGANR